MRIFVIMLTAALSAECYTSPNGNAARSRVAARIDQAVTSKPRLLQAYTELSQQGMLHSFGSVQQPPVASPVDDLSAITLLPSEAFAPSSVRRGRTSASQLYAVIVSAAAQMMIAQEIVKGRLSFSTLRALEWWQLPAIFLAGTGIVTVGVLFADRFALGGRLLACVQTALPGKRRAIVRHEAGHFLLSILLGVPVQSCKLNSLVALLDPAFEGQAGTVFHAPAIDALRRGDRPTDAEIDACAVILMGGIAAEAIAWGSAEGGAADERQLRLLLEPSLSGAEARRGSGDGLGQREALAERLPADAVVRSKARYAVANAVLLLREHEAALAALCEALSRGDTIGECVEAIERSMPPPAAATR